MPILAFKEKIHLCFRKGDTSTFIRSIIKSDPDLSWSLFSQKGIGFRRGAF
jgi:hypothetical protein